MLTRTAIEPSDKGSLESYNINTNINTAPISICLILPVMRQIRSPTLNPNPASFHSRERDEYHHITPHLISSFQPIALLYYLIHVRTLFRFIQESDGAGMGRDIIGYLHAKVTKQRFDVRGCIKVDDLNLGGRRGKGKERGNMSIFSIGIKKNKKIKE